MKKLLMTALFLTFASAALAAARVEIKPNQEAAEAARQAAYDKRLNDHPKTEAISHPGLKIAINTDRIIRSCCQPPDLVVTGHVTNVSQRPINYVHFVFAFEDEDGKVLHAESTYNHRAESMADDEEIRADPEREAALHADSSPATAIPSPWRCRCRCCRSLPRSRCSPTTLGPD